MCKISYRKDQFKKARDKGGKKGKEKQKREKREIKSGAYKETTYPLSIRLSLNASDLFRRCNSPAAGALIPREHYAVGMCYFGVFPLIEHATL